MIAQANTLGYHLFLILIAIFVVIAALMRLVPDESKLQKYLGETMEVVLTLGVIVLAFWFVVGIIDLFISSPSTPFHCPEDLSPADCDTLYNG